MYDLEKKSLDIRLQEEEKALLAEFQEVAATLAPPFSSVKALKYTFGEWLCLNFTILLQSLGYNKSRVAAIKKKLSDREKIILNIGSWDDTKENYVNADLVSLFGMRSIFKKEHWSSSEVVLELTFSDRNLFEFADGIVLSHVLEHIHPALAIKALQNCLAYLKPGAALRVSVPDLKKYEKQKVLSPEISQIQNHTLVKNLIIYGYKHQFMYDVELIALLMKEAGFQEVKESSFGEGLLGDTDVSIRRDESIYLTGIKRG
jgi:predicted SAM-dependent methyltransferase